MIPARSVLWSLAFTCCLLLGLASAQSDPKGAGAVRVTRDVAYVASRRDSRLQSEAFAEALRAAGGAAQVVPAQGKTHRTLNVEIGRPGDAPTAAILRFLSALEEGQGPGRRRPATRRVF